MRATLAALLALAVAGCSSGLGARVVIDRGCASAADRIEVAVEIASMPVKHATLDAASFFAGEHTVAVIVPEGTPRLDVSAEGFAGTTKVGWGHASLDLPARGIAQGVVSMNNCNSADLGETPDLAANDLTGSD